MIHKLLAALGVLAITATHALAVPALPALQEMEINATMVKVRQWGTEKSHGWETSDGYTIMKNGATGRWVYADKNAKGELVQTAYEVGAGRPQVKPHLRPAGPRVQSSAAALKSVAGVAGPPTPSKTPPLTANLPVIMVNFSDTKPTFQPADVETKYFGIGNQSMRDYYEEVSYGKHLLSSGPAGIIGWINAAGPHDYYGIVSGTDHSLSGALTYEAVQKADATVDFSAYDNDGDCYVDTVVIMHQGAGQEASSKTSDIWSHSYDLNSAKSSSYGGQGAYTTNDICKADHSRRVKINHYVVVAETLSGKLHSIGTLCHEYGHVLDLPDLYDTTYESNGAGSWSLMAGGTWLGNLQIGDSPAHLDAWSKYFLGWVQPTRITSYEQYRTIENAEQAPDVVQLLAGSATSGEYFLVENRQRIGFDAALPGSGLLIWHIDTAKEDNSEVCYPGGSKPCTSSRHYKVALEQADGLFGLEKSGYDYGDASDVFVGPKSFTESTLPSSALYSGSASYVRVTAVSSSAATMTATFDVGTGPICSYSVSIDQTSFGATGGTATLKVAGANLGCAWKMPSLPAWIKANTTSPLDGQHDTVYLTVAANPDTVPRSQTFTVAGKSYTITQDGRAIIVPVIDMSLTPASVTSGAMTASGLVTPDSTVKVYRNNVLVGDAAVSPISGTSARWSISVPALAAGYNTLAVTATSIDNRSSSSSKVVTYVASFTIGVTSTTGGAVSPSGVVSVVGGMSQKFTITPASGYEIAKVLVDGKVASPAAAFMFPYVTANHALTVTFAPSLAVDLSATPAAGANSVIAGGIVSANSKVAVYLNGGYVGMGTVLTSADGKTSKWSLPVQLPAGTSTIKAIATTEDARVAMATRTVQNSAKFTVTASVSSGGKVSQTPIAEVVAGSTYVVGIKPDAGYVISRISVDGKAVKSAPSIAFDRVAANHVIEVKFTRTVGLFRW